MNENNLFDSTLLFFSFLAHFGTNNIIEKLLLHVSHWIYGKHVMGCIILIFHTVTSRNKSSQFMHKNICFSHFIIMHFSCCCTNCASMLICVHVGTSIYFFLTSYFMKNVDRTNFIFRRKKLSSAYYFCVK